MEIFRVYYKSILLLSLKFTMKILVIQKKLLGDVLICSVVFELLKKKYPNAELHYLIDKKFEPIIKNHQFIDKIIYFNGFWDTLKKIRTEKYNIIIDTYSKIETALFCRFSSAETSGYYKKYTSFLYTYPIKRSKVPQNPLLTSAIEHRIELLSPFDIEKQLQFPKIYLTEQEKKEAENLIKQYTTEEKPLIMLSLFGSSDEKSYPIEYFGEILNTIKENSSAKILCNYLPTQKQKFEEWYNNLPSDLQEIIVKNFDTTNLRQYIAVVSQCKALIGNEGGSTNTSKALNIPTFSIFAPFISKTSWNWNDDEIKNTSVHPSDYNLLDYQGFTPSLFKDKLINFLKNNI